MSGTRLNTEEIRSRLTDEGTGCRLFYREEVDSTNEWAKREARKGAASGSVFLAERQTAGKGRRGRAWNTAEGTSVSMSLLLRPDLPVDRVSMLTLVMGMAAADGIRKAGGLDVQIKWPNDVIAGGRKLCGILTEMSSGADFVVIGIGINVNVPEFPAELADVATSLFLELGKTVSRECVTAETLNFFRHYYSVFGETADFSGLSGRYEELLANRGCQVRVLDPAAPFCGTALGINDRGELLVKRDDTGETEAVYAGEVSVRGIYGYV